MDSLGAYCVAVRPAKFHFFGLCHWDENIAFPNRSFFCDGIYDAGILPVLLL